MKTLSEIPDNLLNRMPSSLIDAMSIFSDDELARFTMCYVKSGLDNYPQYIGLTNPDSSAIRFDNPKKQEAFRVINYFVLSEVKQYQNEIEQDIISQLRQKWSKRND